MPPKHTVFPPVITAIILVVVAGNMAVMLGTAGAGFHEGLNIREPALSREPPVIGEVSPRLARRVALVIVDGLRARSSYSLPFYDRLRTLGVDAEAASHYPTFSRPNYITIVTGVPPEWSGVRSNHFRSFVPLDTLMERARARQLRSAFLSNTSPGLPLMVTERIDDGGETRFRSGFDEMNYVQWPGGFIGGSQRLIERDYALVVLHHGAVDDAGHEYGADSEEYVRAVQVTDSDIASALAGLDLKRDAIVITADHGHTDSGGHGGLEDDVVRVPLILAGAGIRRGAAIVDAQLVDIAPTVAALLGLPPPGHGIGHTLTQVLQIAPEATDRLVRADEHRITTNRARIESVREVARGRVSARRWWRVPIVVIACVVGIVLLIPASRWGALKVDWRVFFIAVPAFPVTYYAALGLFGQQFSPSAIPAIGDVLDSLFQFGLVAMAAQVAASWLALRGRVVLRNRLAAANALAACGLFVSAVPAGLAWALFSGPYVEVPGPVLLVLIPATLVAVAFYAFAAAVTLSLEIIIFFARAVDPRIRLRRLERAAQRERERLGDDGGAQKSQGVEAQ